MVNHLSVTKWSRFEPGAKSLHGPSHPQRYADRPRSLHLDKPSRLFRCSSHTWASHPPRVPCPKGSLEPDGPLPLNFTIICGYCPHLGSSWSKNSSMIPPSWLHSRSYYISCCKEKEISCATQRYLPSRTLNKRFRPNSSDLACYLFKRINGLQPNSLTWEASKVSKPRYSSQMKWFTKCFKGLCSGWIRHLQGFWYKQFLLLHASFPLFISL